jgi:hypothetical protein
MPIISNLLNIKQNNQFKLTNAQQTNQVLGFNQVQPSAQMPLQLSGETTAQTPRFSQSFRQGLNQRQVQFLRTSVLSPTREETNKKGLFGFGLSNESPSPLISGLSPNVQRVLYDVYVKKNKKFQKVADDLQENRALKFGAEKTLNSIASTFKIVADAKARTRFSNDISRPNALLQYFRNYQIKGNSRIPLKNTFIELAGTRREPTTKKGARLGSFGEIKDIMGFKKQRTKRFKFF